ncbi:MAG TPA: xanthine dehydrogenase family protein molybdopterin-binding subunit [Terriglobia bacterium]|nr:xanthine dehydrogenase family protein molybdopterin-binding subunit [Terriglobia bacterium]
MTQRYVGQAMKRKEDPRLVSGTSTYVDDVVLPGMLHMAVTRSIHAHARIKRVDTSKAQKLPGVVAVVTGEEVAAHCGPIPCAASLPNMKNAQQPLLAMGKVRFVGEPIAAVVAENKYIARDAADMIEIDYEPLPAVTNPEKALDPNSPRLYEEFSDNIGFNFTFESGNTEEAFRNADVIVKERFINQRLAPVAMEPRGVVATYQMPDNELVVWNSTQQPHGLRTLLAGMVRVPENRVRVIAPEVGGGFGSKIDLYAEDGLACYLAKKTGRPVKWIEGRRENMAVTIHGRDQIDDVELALKKDGTILGMRVKAIADLGAFYSLFTPMIPTLTGLLAPGCYKVPALKFDQVGVLTNKMATDAYRGAGRPEATYLIERIMDVAAQKLQMDPAEIRRKNFPKPNEFPFQTSGGVIYDSANYEAALDLALQKADYKGLRKKQAELRQQGKYMGIGLSSYVEICAMGPSSALPGGGWEAGTVRIERTGTVTLLTGASPHGQGQETSFAQIVADEFGIEPDDVVTIHGDTARVAAGIGTFGSRGTAVGGTAIYLAAQDLKEKMKKIAAHLLESKPDKIEFGIGKLMVKGDSGRSMSFNDVVSVAYNAVKLPPGLEPGMEATRFFEPSNFTFPFGTHVCVVEIDEETGEPKLTKYVAVDDCGNVINPLLVEGQVHGGLVQGIAQALHEEVVYDENGQLLTGSLMDYALPRAHDFPEFELDRTVTPSPVNPLGIKGVGEAGTIGSTPAVVNAVVDALAPLGVTHIDMPIRSEKVWRVLKGAERKGGSPQPERKVAS